MEEVVPVEVEAVVETQDCIAPDVEVALAEEVDSVESNCTHDGIFPY